MSRRREAGVQWVRPGPHSVSAPGWADTVNLSEHLGGNHPTWVLQPGTGACSLAAGLRPGRQPAEEGGAKET